MLSVVEGKFGDHFPECQNEEDAGRSYPESEEERILT